MLLHLFDVEDLSLAIAGHDLVVTLVGANQIESAEVVVLNIESATADGSGWSWACVLSASIVDGGIAGLGFQRDDRVARIAASVVHRFSVSPAIMRSCELLAFMASSCTPTRRHGQVR